MAMAARVSVFPFSEFLNRNFLLMWSGQLVSTMGLTCPNSLVLPHFM
jgi:hypothetical protein